MRVAGRNLSPILVATSTLAAAALLARDAGGVCLLPVWLTAALQAPALIAWLHYRCSWFMRSAGAGGWNSDHWLTSAVLLGAVLLGVRFGSVDAASVAVSGFIVGHLILDGLVEAAERIEGLLGEPVRLCRFLVPVWAALLLLATVLLALPIATHSGVPDYRHNFWQHVCASAFAATSACTLTGSQIYGFAEDYSLFGQTLLIVVVQLSGMALAAMGLSIVSPFLSRPISPRTLWSLAAVLEILAALTTWSAWRDEDAGGPAGRLGWSLVHAVGAIWNCGIVMRHDGLTTYLTNPFIFSSITTLAILGSLGLPIVFDLVSAGPRGGEAPAQSGPWTRLAGWEAALTFVALLSTALLFFMFETPHLDPKFVPTRPLAFSQNQAPLRDELDPGARWRMAVFVSATLRSAGFQSMPVEQGAVSWPSLVIMLGGSLVGGTAGGVAGGFRLSVLSLVGICVFSTRRAWMRREGEPSGRGELLRRVIAIVVAFVLLNLAAVAALAATTDGSRYEWVFDGVSSTCNVGFTTGLQLHLTWTGRLVMIGSMILGCWLPLRMWCGVSQTVRRVQAAK